jgi:hypothetical protein
MRYDQQPQNLYLYEQWNTLPQFLRPPWTNIDHNRFDYELCSIRRGASNERFQAETFRILNEKYEHHSKIYTDGSKKDEKVRFAVVLSESTIKKRQLPQNSIYSAEQSAIINNLLHCKLQSKTSKNHRLAQHNNSNLRQKDPRTQKLN